jgi:hypothetical protein
VSGRGVQPERGTAGLGVGQVAPPCLVIGRQRVHHLGQPGTSCQELGLIAEHLLGDVQPHVLGGHPVFLEISLGSPGLSMVLEQDLEVSLG